MKNAKVLVSTEKIHNPECATSHLKTYCQSTSHGVLITEVLQSEGRTKESEFLSVSTTFVQLFGGQEEKDKFIESLIKR